MEQLLSVLNKQPRIAYVTLNPLGNDDKVAQTVKLLKDRGSRSVIEHTIDIGDNRLIVALEAGHFQKRIIQMRKELGFFVLFLVAIGVFTSWWLYRSQRNRLEQAREFERQLAKQHEEAALGRASSTITHELRNPLNAISIGLQRLQYEADELSSEHRQLLTGMREAVARSNNVINRLRQYIHDFRIETDLVDVGELIKTVIDLYRKDFTDKAIALDLEIGSVVTIHGDRDLLGQLFDNLVRNALEPSRQEAFCESSLSPGPTFSA
ncbi:MAG: HAMP domain-containing histidine kinase [Desulfofustis sp.]|nr:HAMP domain-containing histidine kinase [Desulfofustis sp.]